MTAQYLTLVQMWAWLSGAWYNLTPDLLQAGSVSGAWGINGYKATDLLADTGTLNFTLNNIDGKYYPNGPAPLAGWGRWVPIHLLLYFGGVVYCYRFFVDKIELAVGKVHEQDRVRVSCVDWLDFANKRPILAPSIQVNVTADAAMNTLCDAMKPAQPQAREFYTGDNTFLSVFDNVGMKTTAYSEFAKLAGSEWGYCYLKKDPAQGETLVFENGGHRNAAHPTGETGLITLDTTPYFHMLESGDYHLLESNVADHVMLEASWTDYHIDPILIEPATAPYTEYSIYIDSIEARYGENIVNRFTVEAVPKRVDTENVVLYSLGNPILIKEGETIAPFRARYTDPAGGQRVNAIASTMLPPEVPGDPDPSLMTLLHFTADATDSTARHAWTMHDNSMIFTTVYKDGYNTSFGGNIIGPYIVFGGYSPYYLTTPSSTDFNFGGGAFTIGWKEARLDIAANDATLSRNIDSQWGGGFTLGVSDGENMLAYMCSAGGSWDIANGKSMGRLNTGEWTDYEVSRDEKGWFYIFSNGELTDKWYSALPLANSTGVFGIGKTKFNNVSSYTYMKFDEFFVMKGVCLHKKNFTPRAIERKTTLEGDYQLNTADDGSGTDLSTSLSLTATYGGEAVTYSAVTNGSTSDGYLYFLQARGKGVYSFNPVEDSAEDATSQNTYGYQPLSMRQPYQQNVTAGMVKATETIAGEKDPHTDLLKISFVGNRSIGNMNLFLMADIGTLLPIKIPRLGIASHYYIQNKSFSLTEGGVLRYSFGLREDFLHVMPGEGGGQPATFVTVFDENFMGAFTYAWATSAGMTVTGNVGTTQNPGQAELTYGGTPDAYFVYSSGETPFPWMDIAHVQFRIQIPFSQKSERCFFGLVNADFVSAGMTDAIGWEIVLQPGIRKAKAYGMGGSSDWLSTVGDIPTLNTFQDFYITRINATTAWWQMPGASIQEFTGALPADADNLIPVFIYYNLASGSMKASIDRILVKKWIIF